MYINTNKKELQELAKKFYNITKTLISIYDDKENLICSYPDYLCQFCTEVRKSSDLTYKCISCDENAFKICKQTKQTHIYRCHMGLLEVATPIIYNNVILGYMLFGQFTDSENKTGLLSIAKNIAHTYQLDEAILAAGLSKISCYSQEYIQSIAQLLEMCANYIWLNSIISVKKEGIAFSIDLYLKEHLTESLSVPQICHEFNIGKSTLYEISKNNFGCSITEYIRYLRNEQAKDLLKNKDFSVSEVAEMIGIKDVNYFIRFFKKENGCTPKTYQKLH